MSIGRRLLWMVLLLTVVAALWPAPESDTADGEATRPIVAGKVGSNPDVSPLELRSLIPAQPASPREIVDLFPRQGFTPPPANGAPEKPSAPALPFVYAGRYTEGGKVFVFLNEGAKMHTLRQGDTINSTYRIETIEPTAITLTYLPLGTEQTLQTGSPTPP